MPKILKYIYLVLICLLLQSNSFAVKAYIVPDGSQSEALATNEQKFAKAIYNKYIGGRSTSELINLFADAKAYSDSKKDYSDYYRALCSQALVTAVVEGENLTLSTPYIKYFSESYDTDNFTSILTTTNGQHVRSAPAFDCLLATSVLSDYLPLATKKTMMRDYVTFSKKIYNDIAAEGGSIIYFQNRSTNYGNSQAEEAMIVASLLHAAALLLPSSGETGTYLTDAEKTQFIGMTKNIAKWAYSTCPSSGNCSIKSPTGLVVNHQMDPSPIYTLSLLTAYSELAMLYNQQGTALPSDLFDASTKSSLNTIFGNLKKYFASDFTLTGNFNTVGSSGQVTDTYNYSQMIYNPDSNSEIGYPTDGDLPLNSSFPTNFVDSWHQFIYNNSTIYSYTYAGNNVWQFKCDAGVCKAGYKSSISDQLNSVRRKSDNSDLWNTKPYPTIITASSQWIVPVTNDLKVYLFSPTDVWHYTCYNFSPTTTANCEALYVKPISSFWPTNQSNWGGITPPSSDIDAFSQYIVSGTTTLKSYIFKGDRVWAYTCDGMGTNSVNCYAVYTKTLAEYIAGVTVVDDTQGWRTYAPPTTGLESFYQYYSGTTLKSYFIKGGYIWAYACTTGCYPLYVKKIKDSVGFDVSNQYKWGSKTKSNSVKVFNGVADWGFDATVQNSAFSSMYFIDPVTNYGTYNSLQNAQIVRDRLNNPYYPVNYDASTKSFNYNQFIGSKNAKYINYLPNGWRQIDIISGSQLPIGTSGNTFYPSDTNIRVNTHWWMNILSGKNHSIAYLTLSNNKILKKLNTDYSIYDTNNDGLVNFTDALDFVAYMLGKKNSPKLIDYNNSGVSDLVDLVILLKKIL